MKLYHFINAKYGLDSIRDQRFKLSTYDDLNDPFELFATTLTDEKIRRTFQGFKNQMAQTMALLCCSKDWRSSLLWSHYADRHRGLALELDVEDKIITHVEYQTKRLEINESMLDALASTEPGNGIGHAVLATKSADWAYENEARIQFSIAHLNQPQKPLFMPYSEQIKLVGAVIGSLSTITVNDIEQALPAGKDLEVRKARLAFNAFDVVTQRLFKPVRVGRV